MATANAGSSSDCEGEEQEDPSSSFYNDDEIPDDRDNLNTDTKKENTNTTDELSAFREQWQRELKSTPTHRQKEGSQVNQKEVDSPTHQKEVASPTHQRKVVSPNHQREVTPPNAIKVGQVEVSVSDEEKAKAYFLRGADLERGGKWYEAIQHYKRAMQIVPDIESRLYESTEGRAETPLEEKEIEESNKEKSTVDEEDEEETVEGEDLLTRLQRIQARKGVLCEPEHPTKELHISCLPYEVILLIARWVVSSDLDAMSLERLGGVSRGFYLVARDTDIWKTICIKTWGIECGTARSLGFPSWREMYVHRPRLQLHGCYISRTTYLRHGDNSYQDQFYRPWYVIEYYRYLRFFPEGGVLMWTTAEEPASCVTQLRSRHVKPGLGIMAGHYRLIGDKVVIVIKKTNEKKQSQFSNTRFRSRIKEVEHEQTYHLELQVRSLKRRLNGQLWWRAYSVSSRRDQWSSFDLAPASFPPFTFSAVRSYCREARAQLQRW